MWPADHRSTPKRFLLEHYRCDVYSLAVRLCALAAVGVLAISGCSGGDRTGVSRPFPAGAGRGPCEVAEQRDVPATMRDGTVLRADVYRPRTDNPVPVILMRTQYG